MSARNDDRYSVEVVDEAREIVIRCDSEADKSEAYDVLVGGFVDVGHLSRAEARKLARRYALEPT